MKMAINVGLVVVLELSFSATILYKLQQDFSHYNLCTPLLGKKEVQKCSLEYFIARKVKKA